VTDTANTTYKPKPYRKTHQRPVETNFINPTLGLEDLIARQVILAEELSDILASLSSIESQLKRAEAAEANGDYADPLWIRKVNGALSHNIRQRDEHGRALGNLRRRIAKLENVEKSREKAFVAVVEGLLPVESLREIWAMVDAGSDGFMGVTEAATENRGAQA
jgi:hypothetical protein